MTRSSGLTIGIEAQRLFRPRKHGMDVVALELLRRLPALAPQHRFVAFVRPDEDRCLEPQANLDVREVPGASYPSWEQRALPAAAAREGVDLLHCTANTAPLRSPAPVVLTLHDIIFLEGRSALLRGGSAYQRLGNAYRRRVVPGAVRRAARVTTVSGFEADRIAARFPAAAEKLDVVKNAVGDAFRPVNDRARLRAVRERYRLPKRFALLLGSADPKKNIPAALAAFCLYARRAERPVQLVVADLSPERLLAILRKIGAEDQAHRFVLPGYVAHADLPAIYSLCDAFLYPSLRESFGLPILEAMACGAPVVTSDAASMPEVAGGAAHLADPTSIPSMSAALFDVLESNPYRWILRQRGLQRAAAFSWDAAAADMLGVYERVLSASAPVRQPARVPAYALSLELATA